MESPAYSEHRPVIPRQLACILAAVLVATLACMGYTMTLEDSGMPFWTLPVTTVIFAAVIAFAWVAKLDVDVGEDGVLVRYMFKVYEYPRDEILDKRQGDLEDIRNYSKWSLKGVKHKSFSRVGDDGGVALKLKGKRVVVISSQSPETMFGLVPLEIREDQDA